MRLGEGWEHCYLNHSLLNATLRLSNHSFTLRVSTTLNTTLSLSTTLNTTVEEKKFPQFF